MYKNQKKPRKTITFSIFFYSWYPWWLVSRFKLMQWWPKYVNAFFKYLESKIYKIQYRVMLSRYKGKTLCPDCNGNKLRKDANYVTVGGKSIMEIASLNIESCKEFMDGVKLNKHDQIIANRLLLEINSRLQYLSDVGLGYLTLNRQSNSLSGGESQRINL